MLSFFCGKDPLDIVPSDGSPQNRSSLVIAIENAEMDEIEGAIFHDWSR